MPSVTALRAASGGRVAVELDGVPWRTIPAEAVLQAGLVVGGELGRGSARTLGRALRRQRALRVAARAVRARDLSQAALGERLTAAGVAPAVRATTVESLERAGLIDDRRAASERARLLAERGYGDAAIRDRLEQEGFAHGETEAALGEVEPETLRAARVLGAAADPHRAARRLVAKGFDVDSVATMADLGRPESS